MRLLVALMTIVLAAATPRQAAAHFEYYWRHEQVRLTPVQTQRVAELVRRLTAPGLRSAPPGLARAVALHGDCALAERLVLLPRPAPLPSTAVYFNLYPAVSGSDRACAERVIARIEATPGGLDRPGLEPSILYQAGSLWRRIGEEDRARAAIDRAERLYDALEAEDPDDVWSCHGGHCLSSRWYARLEGLRLLHGTPMWRAELRRLAALAAAGLAGGREPEARVGQRVFETLVAEAATHDEEAVGLSLVAGTPYGDARAYHAARMHALLSEGKAAEAVALLPRAGRAFGGGDPRVIAEHFEAFAAVPGFYDRFDRHNFREPSLAVVRDLMERGDLEHAASAVAFARASVAADARFLPLGYAAMEGLAAFLDDPRAPVARLVPTSRGSRDGELGELALFQASRGDWRGFEAAFAEVRDDRVRARVRAELACRASSGGEAAALRGIRRAGILRPGHDGGEERSSFGVYVNQSFLCLLRRGHGDAAIAFAEAIGPVRLKLGIASGLPIWSTLAEPERIRRGLADVALAHAERHDLWADSAIESLALEYERLGDYRQADRIVARVPDAEERARLVVRLIESYMPEPER